MKDGFLITNWPLLIAANWRPANVESTAAAHSKFRFLCLFCLVHNQPSPEQTPIQINNDSPVLNFLLFR